MGGSSGDGFAFKYLLGFWNTEPALSSDRFDGGDLEFHEVFFDAELFFVMTYCIGHKYKIFYCFAKNFGFFGFKCLLDVYTQYSN